MTEDKKQPKPDPKTINDRDLEQVQGGGMIDSLGRVVGGLGKLVGRDSNSS